MCQDELSTAVGAAASPLMTLERLLPAERFHLANALLRLGGNATLAETRTPLKQAEQSGVANEASTTTADQHLNLADGATARLGRRVSEGSVTEKLESPSYRRARWR
jgi:hypothetical protein